MADFNQSINLNPNDAIAFDNRGAAYFQSSEMDNAMADFNQSIEINPNYALAYADRGILQWALAHTAEAIADFQKCLTLNPDATTRQQVETRLQQIEVTPKPIYYEERPN